MKVGDKVFFIGTHIDKRAILPKTYIEILTIKEPSKVFRNCFILEGYEKALDGKRQSFNIADLQIIPPESFIDKKIKETTWKLANHIMTEERLDAIIN